MRIFLITYDGKYIPIDVQPNEYIYSIKLRILELYGVPPKQQRYIFAAKQLEDNKPIAYYNIQNECGVQLVIQKKEELTIDGKKNDGDYNIGFIMKLIKRRDLYVNLIYFDLNMANSENYKYFNYFKADVLGGFYAVDNLDILKKYLEHIKRKDIPFILMSSGSSGKDVIPLCMKYKFIKEVIIFCSNYQYNEHYLKEYPGYVKQVLTTIKKVYEYIKTFGPDKYKNGIERYIIENKYNFSYDEILMDRHLYQSPVITSVEYDKCYFLVHRTYAHFFGNLNNKNDIPIFDFNNLEKIEESLFKINFANIKDRSDLLRQFYNLINIKDNNTFVERAIREYTKENKFSNLFNRIMKNFDRGLISFGYFMGPFLYGLNKYVKENPSYSISQDIILYKLIQCPKIEFGLYKLNLGHVICFPSMTSTSSRPVKFKQGSFSPQPNPKINQDILKIKMLFKYKYTLGSISPGIIIENKMGHDGKYLSSNPNQSEVILFPFTFARITSIKSGNESGEQIQIVEFDIINRTSYIEYTLKNDVEKRFLFSNLD